jgi:hypothetical protein
LRAVSITPETLAKLKEESKQWQGLQEAQMFADHFGIL